MASYQASLAAMKAKDLACARLPQLSTEELEAEVRLKLLKEALFAEMSVAELKLYWPVKDRILDTQLFKVLKAMPKGATLHLHRGAAVDARWVLENLIKSEHTFYHPTQGFRVPQDHEELTGWTPAKQYLEDNPGAEEFFYSQLTLTSADGTASSQVVWSRFKGLFNKATRMHNYYEFTEMMLTKAFETYYQDNVTRLELRFIPENVFNKERTLTFSEELELINRVVQEFEAHHPDFSVGIIFCAGKWMTLENVRSQAMAVYEAMKQYPRLVIGFDLVGEEETERQNQFFTAVLQEVAAFAKSEGNEFPFFFHGKAYEAGETNRTQCDNLYDAVLLDSKRIGHGFALLKFPALLNEVRRKAVCLECCPLSNFILRYVADISQHPALALHRHGVDVTISPDDPCMFGYSGVTHDFFFVFVLWNLGLADLKQFALNSLQHCRAPAALGVWEAKWAVFVTWLSTLAVEH
jgi:adenosine deaminase CECR1